MNTRHDFPADVDYAVKSRLETPVYYADGYLCDVRGWALSSATGPELQAVVIEFDDGNWCEVQKDEQGDLQLFAKALWAQAESSVVKWDLEHKWDAYLIDKRWAAEHASYERMLGL